MADKKKAPTADAPTPSKCPITREQFKKAPPITVGFTVAGQTVGQQAALPRTFESGSMGWYTGDKITVEIDGVPTKVQVGVNLTVVGSKELPK